MTPTAASILASVDAATLTPIVRRLTRRDDLEAHEWQAREVGGGIGNPVSLGIYRFQGVARGRESVGWSVILKLLQSPANAGWVDMGESDDQAHWNYWKRELLVYRSGFLDSLPTGLAAPQCYGAVEFPGDVAALWLEDLGALGDARWNLEQYAHAARALGRLNGAYASPGAQPSFAWLGRRRHHQWLASPQLQGFPWDHPLVAARYGGGTANAFRSLVSDCDRFSDRLDRLGVTVSHGDTYPTNLMLRTDAGGGREVVALDWALLGLEAPGADLGQLTFGALNDLTAAQPGEVIEALFESYLDGLRDEGYSIDPKLARFGFVASAAFRIGLFQLIMMSFQVHGSAGAADGEIAETGAPEPFETMMARRAYELLESL